MNAACRSLELSRYPQAAPSTYAARGAAPYFFWFCERTEAATFLTSACVNLPPLNALPAREEAVLPLSRGVLLAAMLGSFDERITSVL